MALVLVTQPNGDDNGNHDNNAAPRRPRMIEQWTIVKDVIWEVASFLGHKDVVAMAAVNWRFRECIDDTIWRQLCGYEPRQRVPRPFPSFYHYFRVVVLELPDDGVAAKYGKLVQGLSVSGNMIRRERTATFGDLFFPIVRLTGCAAHPRDRRRPDATGDLLLLDRAEHIFVGVASNTASSTSRTLTGPDHHLFVIPYTLPGTLLTLSVTPPQSSAASSTAATAGSAGGGSRSAPSSWWTFTATRSLQLEPRSTHQGTTTTTTRSGQRFAAATQADNVLDVSDDTHELTECVISERVPFGPGWTIAVGLAAHGAACAAL